HEVEAPLASESGNGKDFRELEFLRITGNEGKKVGLGDAVDLVEEQIDRPVEAARPIDGEAIADAETGGCVDDQRKNVDAFEGLLRFIHHLATEKAIGLVDSGRIDEDNLGVIAIQNRLDAVARGLRFRRYDGNFAAYERIDERRFARIGAADNRNEARFE